MNGPNRVLAGSLLVLAISACGGDQKAVDEALARAERFAAAASTNAGKVLPDAVKMMNDSLQKAKDLAAAKQYMPARNTANYVVNKAAEIARSAGPRRQQMDSTYKFVSWAITNPVKQSVAAAGAFTRSGKLPPGVTKEQFDSLKKDMLTWEDTWKAATEAYQKGEIGVAAAKASQMQSSVLGAMKMLNVKQTVAATPAKKK